MLVKTNTYFNDYANASQCYVIRTLPILLFFSHYLTNGTIFRRKSIEYKMCFFDLLYKFV